MISLLLPLKNLCVLLTRIALIRKKNLYISCVVMVSSVCETIFTYDYVANDVSCTTPAVAPVGVSSISQ